ncbi:MAG: hypothetical protein H0X56_08820 [Solirubrobacterales bacterium]|jgi:hypothetical protein|nr:hypothetical protein [Solirubrobacterales bacterium]
MSEGTEPRTDRSAKEEAERQQPEPTRTTAEGDPPETSKTDPSPITGEDQNPGQTGSPAPEDDVGT